MSDRIRSLTLFTALLFAAACGGGGGATTTGSQTTAGAAGPVTPTTATTPTTAAPAAMCGNNKIEGTEMCDGTDLGGKTCAMLVPGSTGIPKCNNCKLDMLLCLAPQMAAAPMGGAGAAQGGSGARTMGTAGAGGSGRM